MKPRRPRRIIRPSKMNYDVKVERSYQGGPGALIHDRERVHVEVAPLPKRHLRALNGETVAFFRARWNPGRRCWTLLLRIDPQPW